MQKLKGEVVKSDSLRNLVEFSKSGTVTPRPAQSNLRDAVENAKGNGDYVGVDIGEIDEGVPLGTATYDSTLHEVISLRIYPDIIEEYGEEL